MSTSVLEPDHRSTSVDAVGLYDASIAPAVPCWWKQRHSGVFAGLVVVNIILTWPMLRAFMALQLNWSGLWVDGLVAGMMGICIGNLYLAAIWLAFGGLSAVLRFGIVIAAVSLGAVCATFGVNQQEEWNATLIVILGVSLLVVLMSQLVLAPLRWLTGWRLDFDADYHPPECSGRMQLRLWHYLALTFLATLPLVVYRVLDAVAPRNEASQLAVGATLLASMTVLVAAPLTWLVLARRQLVRAVIALPLGFALAAGLGLAAMASRTSGSLQNPSELILLVTLPVGALVPVAGNLLLLRLAGLQVFSVKRYQA